MWWKSPLRNLELAGQLDEEEFEGIKDDLAAATGASAILYLKNANKGANLKIEINF